jgi:prevent-host-death family protein
MATYSVAEAKNNLSKLIDLALKGEKVTITRHGAPVVELRPAPPPARPITQADLDWLEANAIRPVRPITEDAGALVSRMRDEEWEGR